MLLGSDEVICCSCRHPQYYFREMLHLRYRPKPPLSDFVELFWIYEGYTQPHAKERIMPDGSMQVIVNLQENEAKIYDSKNPDRFECFPGTIFCGPRSEFEVIDTAGQAFVMGIHFRPGGALPFLRMPLSELQDEVVSLDTLWGIGGRDVRNRLLEALTPEAKLRMLETCLLEQAVRPLERHAAVRGALRFIGGGIAEISIGGLADQIGISRRRFIQLFSEQIGLTPKLFCRVRRFQRVLHSIHAMDDVDWADIAVSAGYFDQAHFNHDFRTFSGINPSTYLRCRTSHLNHVPLLD